jgi:response regulator RpfG family c-di-GMP phosphodiesterase
MTLDFLLVDSSPALRRMMHRCLRMGTMQVGHIHEAGDAQTARHLMDQQWVDGIIASWHIRIDDQTRLVEWLTSDEVMHEIPTFVTTADARSSVIQHITEREVAGVLVKPFQPEELYYTVSELEAYETE